MLCTIKTKKMIVISTKSTRKISKEKRRTPSWPIMRLISRSSEWILKRWKCATLTTLANLHAASSPMAEETKVEEKERRRVEVGETFRRRNRLMKPMVSTPKLTKATGTPKQTQEANAQISKTETVQLAKEDSTAAEVAETKFTKENRKVASEALGRI